MPKRHRHLITMMITMLCGCAGKSYSVANPVLGPPPPRIAGATQRGETTALAQTADASESTEGSDVQQASATLDSSSPLSETAVIARVNGRPLLAGEILEQYGAKLREYEAQLQKAVRDGKLSEAEKGKHLRKAQEMLIRRDMDRMVEQQIMAQAVRSRLKKDQLDHINQQVDGYFEKDVVEHLKKQFKVNSTAELEVVLQDQGTSLESMRRMYSDQQMASQYLRTKIGEEPNPSRAELLEVYRKNQEKYARPMQVKWQQLQISINPKRNRQQAQERMDEALKAIQGGLKFEAAVKKFSDGPLKDNGGNWDWTQPSSVANEQVRKSLETLKPGEISQVIESSGNLQVVKVLERREAGYLPLDQVQDEIRSEIIEAWRQERIKTVMAEIKETAVVETLFDAEEKVEPLPSRR